VVEALAGAAVGAENWQEAFAARATLRLFAAGRPSEPLLFVTPGAAEDAAGEPHLALGSSGLSEVLPAGEALLEARLPGGRVARAPVSLVAGETLDVSLRFP
jgi:hypothetical protein